MPNAITAQGLQTKTQAELVSEFTLEMQTIYGSDINLSQDTPDGQMMLIFIQAVLDVYDLITQVYNGMDPDNAIGTILDQRVALNGIQRQAGTFTVTNITIVTDRALNLYGLDQSANEVFTVSDNEGNEWQLQETQNIAGPGTYVFAFQSAVPGEVLTTPNTITTAVTVVLGVSSVNNPTTYTTLGIDEEKDEDLKVRRQRSVSLASQGYLAGLLAALENISGVVSAFVYENNTGATDGDGIPPFSIWVIVAGTASDAEIADAIYKKRNAGVGMKGDETFEITQVDGSPFIVRWDEVVTENLFIKFTATSLDGDTPVDYDAIKDYLIENFVPGVNEKVNTNKLGTDVQNADPNAFISSDGFSTSAAGVYTETLSPSSKQNQFVLSEANIIILPILTNISAVSIGTEETQFFSAKGGFGTYVWSLEQDESGASLNTSTGEYEAGNSTGTDIVRVTDGQGNFAEITITVS
jgi:hypothetical protein